MRLWHKDLIEVLPRQQLISQWRECCCIVKNIADKGTPNHILVNKVLEYNYKHFYNYSCLIISEMVRRGCKAKDKSIANYWENLIKAKGYFNNENNPSSLFEGWHNDRYLKQCYYNLQEKYDCGGISREEWLKVYNYVNFEKYNNL